MKIDCWMRGLAAAGVAAVALVAATSASADDLTLLCAGAMKPAMATLLAGRAPSLTQVDVTYATAGEIRARFARGERPDLVIAPSDLALDLMKQKLVEGTSRRPLGETEIGVAIRAGAPRPDIGTEEALRRTLLAARKVVIVDPAKGTSGRLMQDMFRFLGLENEMRDKLLMIDGGMVTETVARGDADLGFQQVTEILPVKGVELVGTLPGTLKKLTRYDVAIVAGSAHRPDAGALVRELTSDASRAVIRASGFMDAR